MNTMKSAKVFWNVLAISVLVICSSLMAVPPHPELMEQFAAAKIIKPYYMEHSDELHKKGVCQPEHFFKPGVTFRKEGLAASAAASFRVLAVLVKFSDHDSSVSANFFDSLVFGVNGSTVRNYYSEISYAQLDLITVNMPSSLGWRSAPETYAYYVNGQNGFGAYPNNSQKLCEDIVDQIDGLVNFAQYDNDGNGFVDCLLLIHSGTGAEFSGSSDDIWSHKWSIIPRLKDGVSISSYTVQPEFWIAPGDMTIGVYAHELGHGFGLPDLYDTDMSSYGIGKWCIMSYGSWNGAYPGGGSPAHPCAWSRIEMGFASPTNITSNQSDVDILNVEQNSAIYRLWTSGNIGNEYFLVENRQRTGYDTFLPQSGLLIWHIDDVKAANTQEWWPGQTNANHYRVALEQADGSFEMEHHTDQGDGSDVFPGLGNNTSFDAVSSPNSDAYTLGTSFVGVQNISAVGSVINADLIVGFSAGIGDETELPGTFELAQNFPNPFNPYTTILFSLPINSQVNLDIYNLKGELTSNLVNQRLSAGNHSIVWDGKNRAGDDVASGVYFYRLVTEEETLSKKMLLVK